ncbi:MAG: hypothetical protein E8D45_00480 [Nitrospira sp.]|nr:MAG: hypothetical protein E8D45_00480 [Nitrospira sp.]
MFRFGEDVFFVGEATCAKSAEDGRQRAFANGVQELMNYAQARATAGVEISTQMVFEEADAPGCPAGTVSVWRLLRADADKVAGLPKGPTRKSLDEEAHTTTILNPKDLTPRVGMNRDEILNRFGRPKFITILRGGKETHWDYPQFGLALILDEDSLLQRWRLAGPQGPTHGGKGSAAGTALLPSTTPDSSPPVDLTQKLRDLEQSAPSGLGIVHNKHLAVIPRPPHEETRRPADNPQPPSLAAHLFAPVTRQVPGLGVIRLNNSPYIERPFARYHCEILLYTLSIRHNPDGSGPHTSLDHLLNDQAESELRTAVTAGARAAGYDPRYISVRLTVPINGDALKAFGPNATLLATGAGAAWAVSTAAAILGDPLRSDVSLLGTLDVRQEIASVDGLDEKIGGCRQSTPPELIVSAYQESLDLALSRTRMGLRITPVTTLSEAYQAATGQPLRQAR